MIEIRLADENDVDNIIELFSLTVRFINSRDYSEDQIKIWSSFSNRDSWIGKIIEQNFYVGIISEKIVGFSSIDNQGYLDYMYVHKDYQNQGIATALLNQIERKANELSLQRIWVSASITSKPFFESKGYILFNIRKRKIQNTVFKNSLMEKYLKH